MANCVERLDATAACTLRVAFSSVVDDESLLVEKNRNLTFTLPAKTPVISIWRLGSFVFSRRNFKKAATKAAASNVATVPLMDS